MAEKTPEKLDLDRINAELDAKLERLRSPLPFEVRRRFDELNAETARLKARDRQLDRLLWYVVAPVVGGTVLVFWLLILTGCSPALSPEPVGETITSFATEACSRRIAQLAAPYKARGISSRVSQPAELLDDNRYRLTFSASIDYGNEQKTGSIVCTVTNGGRVEAIEGGIKE